MPKAQANTQTFENLLLAIQKKGISVNTAKAGVSIINVDGLNVEIIAPNSAIYDDLNNYSAVVKLIYKNNAFLFMGDAEAISENEISADVKANVLKVGHHGSDSSTSQSFLNKVSPQYAVISVAKYNSYGHPDPEILRELDSAGVKIFRTDENGTITFKSDGEDIFVNQSPVAVPTPEPTHTPTSTTTPTTAPAPAPKPAPSPVEKKEISVYITKTGSKYHRDGCQYLSKSQISISLDDAKSLGYEPCSKCNPSR